MKYLLEYQHEPSYAFFFGLVLFSIIFPYRYLTRKSWKEVVFFVLAAVMTLAITGWVSDALHVRGIPCRSSRFPSRSISTHGCATAYFAGGWSPILIKELSSFMGSKKECLTSSGTVDPVAASMIRPLKSGAFS